MMRRPAPKLALALVLLIAACSSPRDRCIDAATEESRTIDALILETRENINRGYALRVEPGVRTTLDLCLSPEESFLFCTRREPTVTERPVAIDREEERRKLVSLLERRAELDRITAARVAGCESLYPRR